MLSLVMHATRGRALQVQFDRTFFGKSLLNMAFSRRLQQMEVKNSAAAASTSCVEPARARNHYSRSGLLRKLRDREELRLRRNMGTRSQTRQGRRSATYPGVVLTED
jgi:hypothetical protein